MVLLTLLSTIPREPSHIEIIVSFSDAPYFGWFEQGLNRPIILTSALRLGFGQWQEEWVPINYIEDRHYASD
jgi:hypothetical protein